MTTLPSRRLLLGLVLLGLAAGFAVGRVAWDVAATLAALGLGTTTGAVIEVVAAVME